MKKVLLFAFLFLSLTATSNAQSWKDALGKVVNKVADEVSDNGDTGVLGNVLGTLLGNAVPLTSDLIEGTWNYEGVACVLESESALTEMGGTVVTSKLESRLDGYLAKVGVEKGSCSFTFSANDSCVFAIKGREIHGVYKIDAEEKKIDFSFVHGNLNFKTYVAYNVTDMNIVFDADRLLALIKNVTTAVTEKTSGITSSSTRAMAANSALSTVETLLNSSDGMMLGMKLKK